MNQKIIFINDKEYFLERIKIIDFNSTSQFKKDIFTLPEKSLIGKFSLSANLSLLAALSSLEYRGKAVEIEKSLKEKGRNQEIEDIVKKVKKELDESAFRVCLQWITKRFLGVNIYSSEGRGRDDVEAFEGGQYIGVKGIKKLLAKILGRIYNIYIDVIEGTTATVYNHPSFSGGSSIVVEGEIKTLGALPDSAYVDLIITNCKKPVILDPQNGIIENLRKITEANQINLSNLEVVIIGRSRELTRIKKMLPDKKEAVEEAVKKSEKERKVFTLSSEVTGLTVDIIPDGTFMPGIKAGLGEQIIKDKHLVLYSSSGPSEALMNLASLAPFIEEDAIGFARVLAKEVKDTEEKLDTYKFSTEFQNELKFLRKEDWQEIVRGEKLFSLKDATKGPKDATFVFITDNHIFNQPGIEKQNNTLTIRRLRIKKEIFGKPYIWLEELKLKVKK